MNKFDFSLYETEEEEPSTPISVVPKKEPPPKKPSFDFSLYEDETPEKPKEKPDEIYNKYYKAPDYSPEELKKMSLEDRMQYAEDLKTDREYRQSSGFTKQALSELSFGFSERLDELKPKETDLNTMIGGLAGSAPFYALGFGLLGKAVGMLPKAYKWTKNALHVLGAGGLGGAHTAAKQAGKGENFDLEKVAWSAGEMAVFDAALKVVPGAYKWLKSLTGPQQEALLVGNRIPENMTPTQFKFYKNEVVPSLQEIGEAEYQNAYKIALEENDRIFKQEMANVQGKHENDLYKIKQLENEHAARVKEIEEANRFAMKQYEASKAEWEATKERENVVQEAIKAANEKSESSRDFKLTEGKDAGVRPSSPEPETTDLQNTIGEVISKEKTKNATEGGEETTAAIRGSSKADRKAVSKLYDVSDELNTGIEATHQEVASELRAIIEDLESKGNLTPQEQEIKKSAKITLDNLIEYDAEGNVIGLKPVTNTFLLDQAKTLRNKMYYEYAESNATGVYNPLINLYQSAAKEAAINTGNQAAANANDVARAAHMEWSRLYKNRYIAQWRNLNSNKPTSLYENALSIDNFRQIDRVLSRTNSGQNLSQKIRRDLINKKLSKFYKNPKAVSLDEFYEVLDSLDPILEAGERSKISNIFKQSRKSHSKSLNANKIDLKKPPSEPKLEKIPKSKVSQPSFVKIPLKKPIKTTPAMREASKLMNITEEEAMKMTESPAGIRKLRDKLSGTQKGERLFQEMEKNKVGDILYRKNYKGNELNKIVTENYDILSEILGEQETNELLKSSEKIGERRVTKEGLLKLSKNFGFIKALSVFGVI